MYCKYCGKAIDDDSVFCKHCGKVISDADKSEHIVANNENAKARDDAGVGRDKGVHSVETGYKDTSVVTSANADDEERDGPNPLFIVIAIVIFISLIAIAAAIINNATALSDNGESGYSAVSNKLREDDYECTTSQGITTYSVSITPKRNIASCDVELKLYDDDGAVLYADTITKTDLKKGSSYTYTFEFGVLNSLSGKRVKYNISGERK